MQKIRLTKKERRLAYVLCNTGESNDVIAHELDIAVPTVKIYLANMRRKISVATGQPVKNRVQLVLALLKWGIQNDGM